MEEMKLCLGDSLLICCPVIAELLAHNNGDNFP